MYHSFKRNTNISKYFQQQKTVNFGIPSLDNLINGNIQEGSLILIKEDKDSKLHLFIQNIFIAECISNEYEVSIFSRDVEFPCIPDKITENELINEKEEKMVFAWRYNHLNPPITKMKYDLTKKMNLNDKKKFKIFYDTKLLTSTILENIKNVNRNSVISIYSFLSPLWFHFDKISDEEIYKFLFSLRKTIKETKSVCLVSIPSFFKENIHFNLYFDIIFNLKSFLFTNICPNYSCILNIEKMVPPFGLKENDLDSLKYGILIKRNNMVVEKVVLPPEDIVGVETTSCSTNITNQF
ncbi:subunit of RNA polymerase II elongator protein [Hamiltosporidium tvaerminnensis]|uniref:Elongator complex protein 4 n=1 Tax=Hamiltosporidium tvaerminnensis TaxID=1176355 RepID=A0A4Q9LX13_9MICR|nr:subunit of RNA polymerase II elongator protein [Hamiltosporidium tvaerminnensis]